jgi:DNA repair exonuclease SbcCD ATPase subunit
MPRPRTAREANPAAVEAPGGGHFEVQARLDLAEESIRGLAEKVRLYKGIASKYGRARAELQEARAEAASLRAELQTQQSLTGQASDRSEALVRDLEESRSEAALLRDRVEDLTSDLQSRTADVTRLEGLVAEQARAIDELVRAYEERLAEEGSRFEAERASSAANLSEVRGQFESETGRSRAEREALGRELEAGRLARALAESRAAILAEERDRLASEAAAARALASDVEACSQRRAAELEGRIRELESSLATARDRHTEADSLRQQLDASIREGAACRAEYEQFRARVEVSFASLRDQANQKIGELRRRLQDASERMKRLTQELRAAALLKETLQTSVRSAAEAGLLPGPPAPHPGRSADLPRPIPRSESSPAALGFELESESEWVRTLLDDRTIQPTPPGSRPSNGSPGRGDSV